MPNDNEYSREEQQAMIASMKGVTLIFHPLATQTGCHAFIEFCGFMNEFIKVCETTLAQGKSFAMSNTHNEQPLVMLDYQARYLAEKFDCIFGPTLRNNPEARAAFLHEVFGITEKEGDHGQDHDHDDGG